MTTLLTRLASAAEGSRELNASGGTIHARLAP